MGITWALRIVAIEERAPGGVYGVLGSFVAMTPVVTNSDAGSRGNNISHGAVQSK